jgi:hypothetical protein
MCIHVSLPVGFCAKCKRKAIQTHRQRHMSLRRTLAMRKPHRVSLTPQYSLSCNSRLLIGFYTEQPAHTTKLLANWASALGSSSGSVDSTLATYGRSTIGNSVRLSNLLRQSGGIFVRTEMTPDTYMVQRNGPKSTRTQRKSLVGRAGILFKSSENI